MYVRYPSTPQKNPLHVLLINKGHDFGSLFLVSKSSEMSRHNFDLAQYSASPLRLPDLKKRFVVMATKWLPTPSSNYNYSSRVQATCSFSSFLIKSCTTISPFPASPLTLLHNHPRMTEALVKQLSLLTLSPVLGCHLLPAQLLTTLPLSLQTYSTWVHWFHSHWGKPHIPFLHP